MSGRIEKIGWALKKRLPRPLFVAARDSYKEVRSWVRTAKRSSLKTIDKRKLSDDLRKAGIKAGDVIMVHSSLSQVGNVEGGARAVIDSLFDVVTPKGTVLMPSFSSAELFLERMQKGEWLDLRTEPGVTGKITEVFRNLPGVKRSSHPFSSICAWGEKADYVTRDHAKSPKVCHADSPLTRLMELDGKILGLGISFAHVSFYHVIEDTWEGFPFNTYGPPFVGRYIDFEGHRVERELLRYDPQVSRTRLERPEGEWCLNTLTERFKKKNLAKLFKYGDAQSWWMNSRELYEEQKICAAEGLTIYSTRPQN